MEAILAEVVKQLVPGVVTLVGLVLSALIAVVAQWLRSKIKNENVFAILTRLLQATEVTVDALAQTIVDDLKAASDDGLLTEEEIKGIQAKAIASVMVHLGPQGIKELKGIVGNDLNALILSYIEAQVAIRKS